MSFPAAYVRNLLQEAPETQQAATERLAAAHAIPRGVLQSYRWALNVEINPGAVWFDPETGHTYWDNQPVEIRRMDDYPADLFAVPLLFEVAVPRALWWRFQATGSARTPAIVRTMGWMLDSSAPDGRARFAVVYEALTGGTGEEVAAVLRGFPPAVREAFAVRAMRRLAPTLQELHRMGARHCDIRLSKVRFAGPRIDAGSTAVEVVAAADRLALLGFGGGRLAGGGKSWGPGTSTYPKPECVVRGRFHISEVPSRPPRGDRFGSDPEPSGNACLCDDVTDAASLVTLGLMFAAGGPSVGPLHCGPRADSAPPMVGGMWGGRRVFPHECLGKGFTPWFRAIVDEWLLPTRPQARRQLGLDALLKKLSERRWAG